jgi:hypothetical protein
MRQKCRFPASVLLKSVINLGPLFQEDFGMPPPLLANRGEN